MAYVHLDCHLVWYTKIPIIGHCIRFTKMYTIYRCIAVDGSLDAIVF